MLHGEIKMNGITIGEWFAERRERHYPPNEENGPLYLYECFLKYRDIGGYPMEAKYEVKHRYGDGALRLAANVIAKGKEKAKRVGPRER